MTFYNIVKTTYDPATRQFTWEDVETTSTLAEARKRRSVLNKEAKKQGLENVSYNFSCQIKSEKESENLKKI